MFQKRFIIRMSAAIIIIMFAHACGRPQPPPKTESGANNTLRFDVYNPFISLNPVVSQSTGSSWVIPLIHSYLSGPHSGRQPNPYLAQSWKYDKKTFSWHINIRQNATFHDGTHVTAKDVIFSIENILAVINPTIYKRIRSIKLISAFSFIIDLVNDNPDFWKQVQDLNILPSHVPIAAQETSPIGAGPFLFEKKIDNRQITLSAFEQFYNGRPKIDRIIFHYIPNQEQSWDRLVAGKTDIAPRITPKHYAMMEHIQNQYHISTTIPGYCWILLYNSTESLFRDPAVRRAVSKGINCNHIVKKILMGYGQEPPNPLGVVFPFSRSGKKQRSYAPDECRKLLKSAGWKRKKSDGLYYQNDIPFEFTLLYPRENSVIKQVAQYIKLSLYELGMKVFIKPVEFETLKASYIHNNEFQVVLTEIKSRFSGTPIDDYIKLWVPSENKCAIMGGFHDADLSKWYRELTVLKDLKARQPLYRKIEKKMTELHPTTALFHKADIDAVSKKVQTNYPFKGDVYHIHNLYRASILSDVK